MKPERIILSRTDNLGDVILSLPAAGAIKQQLPDTEVLFLGKSYTKSIISRSEYVDGFINWEEIRDGMGNLKAYHADCIVHLFPVKAIATAARKSRIRMRIGTSHRFYHWWNCNKLINLGRKNSDLHEAQLNLQLLQPLGIRTDWSLPELPDLYGWQKAVSRPALFPNNKRFNLVLHVKSKGSAREWPAKNYVEVVNAFAQDCNIFLTGTEEEGKKVRKECPELFSHNQVINTYGQLTLGELIELIEHADGLIAASTGPLHIAAASGIRALGLYPAERPMHAGRWGPVGHQAEWIEESTSQGNFLQIEVSDVVKRLQNWLEGRVVR